MKSTLQEHTNLKKREAEKLWDELRTSFHVTADKVEKIIYTKAWIPLGYDSFTDAWTAEVGNIPLAAELRAHVIYQMFSDGLSPGDVAEHVKDVGHEQVENIFRQKKSGVPPEHVSWHVVRKYVRKNPSPSDTVHTTLGVERLNMYKEIAEKLGRSVDSIARDAIIEKFEGSWPVAKCKCSDRVSHENLKSHGTKSGYDLHGCRCDKCVEARRLYHWLYRRRRQANDPAYREKNRERGRRRYHAKHREQRVAV